MGGLQKYGECFEIPAGREDLGFQNTVVSQFLESQKFVLCNSSEVGVRKRRRRGNRGGRKVGGFFCSKTERSLGDLKTSAATIRSQQPVRLPRGC